MNEQYQPEGSRIATEENRAYLSSLAGLERQPGEFIFQCHIFLPFHTVHGGSQGKNTEVICHSLLQ